MHKNQEMMKKIGCDGNSNDFFLKNDSRKEVKNHQIRYTCF